MPKDEEASFHKEVQAEVAAVLAGPLPEEAEEFPDLPRLVLPFNRTSYGLLRQLIDFINRS